MGNLKKRLANFIDQRKCTILGVGPMSLNCVDVTIDLANSYDIPILLISSRRQIDSKDFGGGYVNNWTTDEFAKYVVKKDIKKNIYLSRDHGGPWQNEQEQKNNLSLKDAMESAKKSYLEDIKSGYKVLHIDPSIDVNSKPTIDQVLERIFELYEFCCESAQKFKKEIIFEIGTEEQSSTTNSSEELEYTLNKVNEFCDSSNFTKPTFVVVQTGTKVLETRNIGSFESAIRIKNEIPASIQLPILLKLFKKYDYFMKAHNCDYLSSSGINWHPRLGIHAANVAPEFGVCETRSLINLLETNNLKKIADQFLDLSYKSKKWEKWLIPNSQISDREKSIIAGHYSFSSQEGIDLRKKAEKSLSAKDIDMNKVIKQDLKKSICRYILNFRMIR